MKKETWKQLLSDSTSQWTPLLLAIQFPLLGLVRDLHPKAHAEHTDEGSIRHLFIVAYRPLSFS